MSAVFLYIGALTGLWGAFWYSWDHNANTPAWLLGTGITGLLIGYALSQMEGVPL